MPNNVNWSLCWAFGRRNTTLGESYAGDVEELNKKANAFSPITLFTNDLMLIQSDPKLSKLIIILTQSSKYNFHVD